MGRLINIDNGGTLTDVCVIDGDTVLHTKTLTTPHDLSKCFFEGIKKASYLIYGEDDRVVDLLLSVDHIRYSTTQGTNALVERKGPRLGLIVARRADAEALSTAAAERALFDALVDTRVVMFDGAESDEDFERAVVAAVNTLTNAGANRIVVSLSGDDPRAHEARFKDAVLLKFPRQLLGVVPVLCATDLDDDPVATRRTWTALINAFLHPTMERFLYSAEGILREYYHQHPLLIFRNDGDSSRVARTIAAKTYSSGPRGGMEGARALAAHYGYRRLLTMDVGGTTTDIGLVENGEVVSRPRGEIEGVQVSFALSDVASVGVGGSSILRVDGGALRVGPESAGGAPGPACFGLGGQDATITDVFLLTGLIDPATYFGGSMTLDAERARNAVQTNIADGLGVTLDAALDAAERAWCTKVADSLKRYTQMDADTALAAFGGAGPFLVTDIADAAGLRQAIIPGLAAVFSAFGIGFSDIAQRYQRQVALHDAEAVAAVVDELLDVARRDMFAEGFEMASCQVHWGVGDEHAQHDWSPGTALPQDALTASTPFISLRVVRPLNRASLADNAGDGSVAAVTSATRTLRLPGQGPVTLPVYTLDAQPAGATAAGPCILEEAYFTGRIGAGWTFTINSNRDTLLTRADG